MGKMEELAKLDRATKDGEIRCKTFKANIDTIQKELDFLSTIERQLQENISYLKNIKIVAMAVEYKKAKDELKKVKNRSIQLKSDIIVSQKALKELELMVQKNRESYDKLSKQNDNNVLQGKFGKRNA